MYSELPLNWISLSPSLSLPLSPSPSPSLSLSPSLPPSVIRIGFEQRVYSFAESPTQRTREVCVEVEGSRLSRDLTLTVQWTPGTATSMCVHNDINTEQASKQINKQTNKQVNE